MNALVRKPLVEILGKDERVTLVCVLHPLKLDSQVYELRVGLSLLEMISYAEQEGNVMPNRFDIWLSGNKIDPHYWARIRPKADTVVLIRAVAENFGDSSIWKTVLTIAVIAGGLFLGPVLGPLLGISAQLATSAILVGGQLLVGLLFPVGQPQLTDKSKSQTYSIGGGANTIDKFGVIPSHLGTNRYWPKLAAEPYTEFSGKDQYLRMLFLWGYGPLEISNIKIGETPITDYSDVEIETFYGYDTDTDPTLYPSEVIQEDLSVSLTEVASWQQRTTSTLTAEISLDFIAPQGIVRVDTDGASHAYTVSLRIEYSPTGAGTWTLLDTLDIRSRSTDPIRRTVRKVVASGQYDVRVRKTSSDYAGTSTVQETIAWTALRSMRNSPPVEFDAAPLALTALRIKATSQLNGVIQDLNGIVSSKVNALVAGVWTEDTVSSNPADLLRHVLQGPANARPRSDDQIDLDTLVAWHAYNITNGFTFDMVRDFSASVFDTLTDIAAAGRATLKLNEGKWSVVWDDVEAPIVQHFSPRNSFNFSHTRIYRELPHAWRVRFVNRDKGYAQDEMFVYDDGYTVDNATLFEQIEFPGQVNPDNIWKHGRFHIAQVRLRPEIYSFETDIEHIVATRGDRIRVTHDLPLWGQKSGRVVGVSGNQIALDDSVIMETGTDYSIRFRLANGSSVVRTVSTNDGEQTEVTVTGVGNLPAIGDLFMFGEANEESVVLRIRSITINDQNNGARITAVDDAPEISEADTGTIPAFSSHISDPIDLFAFPPINLSAIEVFEGVDGALTSGVYFTWDIGSTQTVDYFETEYRDETGNNTWTAAGTVTAPEEAIFIAGLIEGNWGFRVRSVFSTGAISNWAEITSQSLEGLGAVPLDDITNLRSTYNFQISALWWDEIATAGVRYEIRKGDTWASALMIGDPAHPPFVTYGAGKYWVAAVAHPIPGVTVYSTNPTSIDVVDSILVENVVAEFDEAGDGWLGTITGPGEVGGGNFITNDTGSYAYYANSSNIIDVGFARPTKLGATWKATGFSEEQNILDVTDILTTPDILDSAAAQYVLSHVEISIAQEASGDAFAAPDIFAEADAFSVGGGSFSAWTKFAPGVYVGRYFRFRLALQSTEPGIVAAAVEFSYSADVPDRNDHLTNYSLADTGETFDFTPDGSATATPFNGGPNGATVPNLQVTWNETDGDQLVITSLSLSSVTIQIKNGGFGVARTINAVFQGW